MMLDENIMMDLASIEVQQSAKFHKTKLSQVNIVIVLSEIDHKKQITSFRSFFDLKKLLFSKKQQYRMMYKKPTQPPSSIANPTTKKTTKGPQKMTLGLIDKKFETGNTQFKNRDEQLLLMVKEYLQMCGYVRSFETLKNEKPNLRAKVQLNQQQAKAQLDKNHILQLFDRGMREEFFKQTAKVFHNPEDTIRKLEFQINVYFCIYNIHPFLKKQPNIDKANADAFRKYLENKGADLSQTSQFLNYFALPFMPKPQEHKALAHVFTKQWIAKLRNKLTELLNNYLKNSNSFPQNNANSRKMSQLQQLYYNSLNSINSSREQCKENCNHSMEIEHLKKENNELRIIIENYQKKFQQFTESSKINLLESNQKWFNFSRQIFLFAKQYIREDKAKIMDKYNQFFISSLDDHIEANEISLFDKNSYINEDLSIAPDLSKQKIAMKRQETINQICQIDHVRIRGVFLLANNHEKEMEICMILKALRKRLTKKSESAQRREIIIEYSRADVCGVNEDNYIIQKKLLFDGGDKVKTLYLKFMEILTTDALGLQYLTKSKKLIENLVGIFSIQREESKCRRLVLGILQRVSFSKVPRMQMIKLGIIPIIFNIFKNQANEISDFTIQFSIATWMNLSLKKESYPDFEKHKTELIQIVMEQMVSPIQNIRDYINGTIFLLLTSKEIKAEALRQKMDEFIRQLIESKLENACTQQFVYILDRLTGKEDDNANQDEDSDSEEEEEPDAEEFQDEEDGSASESSEDDFSDDMEIAIGEEFLIKNYALLGPEAMREQLLTKSVLDETSKRLNNMTTSINRSRRLDNIFQGKGNATVLQPELDNILNRKKG